MNATSEALAEVRAYMDRKHRMANRLDPTFVRAQIAALRAACPDIDDDEQLLSDMLEAETELDEFLTAVVVQMRDTEARIEGIDEWLTETKARQSRFERRVEAMRRLAFKLMEAAGVRKRELPLATLSIRAGAPRVIVTDEAALPPDCVRIKREPDKTAIRERMARGDRVDGAELSNSEAVLSVRIK